MTYVPLTPEQHTELHALRAEFAKAAQRAVDALHAFGPNHNLDPVAVTLFEEADHELDQLRRRIKAIVGKKT
jgi:hypothetical protein